MVRQPDMVEQATDRDIVFALLSRIMSWTQASTATAKLILITRRPQPPAALYK